GRHAGELGGSDQSVAVRAAVAPPVPAVLLEGAVRGLVQAPVSDLGERETDFDERFHSSFDDCLEPLEVGTLADLCGGVPARFVLRTVTSRVCYGLHGCRSVVGPRLAGAAKD